MVEICPFKAHSLSDVEKYTEKAKELLFSRNNKDLCPLLVQKTDKDSVYLYRIDYRHPQTGNSEFVYGFVTLMKVDDPEHEKQIFGHERLFEKRAEEIYECFKSCDVQFNPIIAVFKDYGATNKKFLLMSEGREPIIDAKIDNPEARHRVWAFDDPELIRQLKSDMGPRRVILADGHHRYSAAEMMRDKDGVPWVMTMFVDVNNPGLVLMPWHRVLRHLEMDKFLGRLYDPTHGFRVYEAKSREDMVSALGLNGRLEIRGRQITGFPPNQKKGEWQSLSPGVVYFGLQFKKSLEKHYLITIDDTKLMEMASKMGEKVGLELNLLHIWLVNRVIPKATPVEYFSSIKEVEKAIKTDDFQLAIYIPALKKDDIILKAVWEKKPVPEKATCFRPKAKTGVLFWKIPEKG